MSLLLMLLLAGPAASGSEVVGVSKCRAEDGAISYQEGPCPDGTVPLEEIRLNRSYAEPTGQGVRSIAPPNAAVADLGPGHKGNPHMQFVIGESSFECSAGTWRFYRHTYCPEQVHQELVNDRGAIVRRSVLVTARIVPRAEACAAILDEAAKRRPGHEYDDIDPPGEVRKARCKRG